MRACRRAARAGALLRAQPRPRAACGGSVHRTPHCKRPERRHVRATADRRVFAREWRERQRAKLGRVPPPPTRASRHTALHPFVGAWYPLRSMVSHATWLSPMRGGRPQRRRTPLHLSARRGHVHVVEALVTAGADVNARNNRGCASPRLASPRGDVLLSRTPAPHRPARAGTDRLLPFRGCCVAAARRR